MTLRNLYYNYTGYPNYYAPGGNLNFQEVTEEENPDLYNEQIGNQKGDNKFLTAMNSSGGGGWAAAIGPAATNIANAFTDTESSTAERVAGAMGIAALAKQWTADTSKGDAKLKEMQNNLISSAKPNYIQDASSTWGANNAVKLNSKSIISPISSVSGLPSLKDFKGNWWRNMGASVVQGAASGSVGGPWGALGGAVTGLLGSIGGLFGRTGRAQKAYDDFLAKRRTLMSAQQSAFDKAVKDQTLSNMQALANGNTQQRINDMANIRAYGGNLFEGGGDLTDEQQMVLADIQADPRILFTPKYSQWRDYIRRISPDYLDRLYASLPYEQQQDIYQNDREAWGALSNEAKGRYGAEGSRRTMNEAGKYTGAAMGIVGMAPAMETVAMFPMLENGLNTYFGYEGAKNLPTAVTDAYDYAKKGDWSRAGLSAGEAVLDGMFIGNGIKGVKNLSELSGLSDRIYNTFPILDPYTTPGATFGYHGTSALDRLLGTISRRNGFTYKPEIPEFHRRLRINEPNDMRFDENGNFILSSGRTGEGHDGIVNFATSEPARGHRSHKTLSGIDDYIVNPEALKNQEFISIEPSDTFFETSELSINPKDITLVSGDTKLLDYAKSKGFNTLSSPRLREYYRKNHAKPTTSGKNSNKLSITKEGADVSPRDVGDEIQRLTSKRGAPTLEDYRFFENETGLPSGVVPIEEYNAVGQQALYGHSPSLRANLNWNNVAYDPATQVESLYRKAKINPDDAEAVKKYNDYIDNLKRINNNTEYAMGGNLYTDLSPNMMSLWNNKQQIDQQKVNMQQMNFGLGNSFNYKNMFPDGGVMDEPDTYDGGMLPEVVINSYRNTTPEDAYWKLYKELAARQPGLHDSEDDERAHTYNVLSHQNPYSSYSLFDKLFKPSPSGYLYNEQKRRKEASDKAFSHSGGSGGWNSKLTDEDIERMVIEASSYDWDDKMRRLHKYEEEKKNGKKYEIPKINPNPFLSVLDKVVDYFSNRFDYGGSMNGMDLPTGMQSYDNGGTHEQNPYGGIQVGVDQQGNPNLVEEGEFRWGDYVFSDRINVDPTLLSRYNLAPATKHQGKKANKGKLSYADMAKKYAKKNGELANDPIGKNTLEAYMKRLQDAQEDQKFQDSMEQQKQDAINQYRNALTTPQQGNPMYGAMKYNGMGNAATQQGVNAGMSDLGQQGGGNEVLSNTNRSGNNMLHAMGGNLYPIGGWLGRLFGKKQAQDDSQNYGNEWHIAPQAQYLSYGEPETYAEKQERWGYYPDNYNEYTAPIYDNIMMNPLTGRFDLYTNAKINNAKRYGNQYYRPKTFENNYIYNVPEPDENGEIQGKFGYEEWRNEPFGYRGGTLYTGNGSNYMDLTDYIKSPWLPTYDTNLFSIFPQNDLEKSYFVPTEETIATNNSYIDIPGRRGFSWTPFNSTSEWKGIRNLRNYDESDPEAFVKNLPNSLALVSGITPEQKRNNYEKYLNSLDIKGRQQLLVNHGYNLGTTGDNGDGVDGDWGNKSKAAWDDFNLKRQAEYNTNYNTSVNNFRQQTGWTDNNLNLGVRDGDATTDANNSGNGQTSYGNAEGNTNIDRSNLTGNINTGNTTTGTYATNAFKEDREGVPLYSTAGKFATFGKGLTPMLYDWMNKTNTKYDPNQRPANELVDMGNNSTFLRTADTIGGYRAPNLMDAERMNNAAQAQGLAALQSALSVGNGNRGFAAAQANQQMYNTGMGIGNNYTTAQQANNEERYKTDAYNTAIDQFNANARNTSYQDNQKAEQVGQQMALSAKQAANDYLQKENWYADRTNRTAMDNRATNQAAWTDNALNYFITQAQENAERNRQNNDITKRYWSDKDGVMHYIGGSGLNGKIREYFRKNNIDNGTFTGDRLAAFNSIIQNNSAKDVANEKGEFWSTVQGLMDDEIAARNKETADADKAKADELQEYRDQFDSELAQLGRYAANKDIYGNYWTSSGDLDYYGKEGFRDSQSLSQLKRAIEMLRTHNDRYNKWTPQNVTAYGGRINNGNKSNKNGYYTYTY